ncbi:SCO2524 family protein [Stackebrandtia nassauensis]|uniref:Uncharacterized protein n=1 Tax=Stackebrandtia nassauensis (strain DSM 44728 / CIP 108903 / NRRL B-16338 / NBRC 102104 / LLR-40K-21) TaxID=446470 RepID=D3QB55_STANL|nr:SCO2524 family protein [Stackebrandtia nassauensis]ADD40872.1 hypothetical protein Snas_1162 [Stackebrandtia nassauensis DSM 44728]
MKIQPRQQLLDVWRALVNNSFRDGEWHWAGGKEPDSVINAQQMLCLMSPVMEINTLRFSRPNETYDDVAQSLRGLGDAVEAPRTLIQILTEYYEMHQVDGIPLFNGANHFTRYEGDKPPEDARRLDIVEGFALSVTLSLSVIDFARSFRVMLTRESLIDDATNLERLASQRLTAAMTGLLRSFTVNTFDYDSLPGEIMLATANQTSESPGKALDRLRADLQDVTAGLRDLRLGSGDPGELSASTRLYEVGWSWGVIKGAPKIEFLPNPETQRDGVALDAPYLYFTVVALDAVSDLFSERTRLLALLDEEQQRLAQAIQLRYDLTQRYWSILATFSQGRWPLEDLPWRTTDGEAEDYFSLLITSISIREFDARNVPDRDVWRLGEVLRELSNRGRITRRPLREDPAIPMHAVGMDTELSGIESTGSDLLGWKMLDYAALVFKRIVGLTRLLEDNQLRARMSSLIDDVWEHIRGRQSEEPAARGLWDAPSNVFDGVKDRPDPTWQITLRVVEGLVYASDLASAEPLRSERLISFADELLSEAKQLYDKELQRGGVRMAKPIQEALREADARLVRAQRIIESRPGSSVAILLETLRDLDKLDAARRGSDWSD